MAFIQKTWVNKSDPTFNGSTSPPLNASNLNRIEQGITDANTNIVIAETAAIGTAIAVGGI